MSEIVVIPPFAPLDLGALRRTCAEIGALFRRIWESIVAAGGAAGRFLVSFLSRRAVRRVVPTARAVRIARRRRRRELAGYIRQARR